MICGAFYPNYFSSSDLDEAEVMKIMSGHDPCTTVIVSETILSLLHLFQVFCFSPSREREQSCRRKTRKNPSALPITISDALSLSSRKLLEARLLN